MMVDEGSRVADSAVVLDQIAFKRPISIFDLPENFFDSSSLLHSSRDGGGFDAPSLPVSLEPQEEHNLHRDESVDSNVNGKKVGSAVPERWSCNTCKAEFESLLEQRSHFKSDYHRFNVKLNLAGKDTLKEEAFDELTSESFSRDFDVSSISGSDDEDDRLPHSSNSAKEGLSDSTKRKLFIRLQSGERVSVWKSFVMKDNETILRENEQPFEAHRSLIRNIDVMERLKSSVLEPRDNSRLRVFLLARGGHFAGCVFDGSKVVAHKTFHRYVVRAKAGKKQSSKDAGGKSIHSAGASIRRYNELALKKDIQDLLASWKSYFDASSCVFLHAPSDNRQLFFSGDKPLFSHEHCDIRSVPLTVRRPTFKEAQRLYNQLSQVGYEVTEDKKPASEEKSALTPCIEINGIATNEIQDALTSCSISSSVAVEQTPSVDSEAEEMCTSTPLHEAAKSGDIVRISELLEEGLDPTATDERGRTPYMLANEKEVRNAFRRFMAENLDKWDWNAAKVPSALTKELEESQAAKQAEKDAKRKARLKELKKSRKAKEKKAQAEAEAAAAAARLLNKSSAVAGKQVKSPSAAKSQPSHTPALSKEEELRKKLREDREKRAAAAEKRIAAAATAAGISSTPGSSSSSTVAPTVGSSSTNDPVCSCCNASLAGKVPFHRYNYKYCSTTCMHVHNEFLEDG